MTRKAFLKALEQSSDAIGTGILNKDPEILAAIMAHILRESPECFRPAEAPGLTTFLAVRCSQKGIVRDQKTVQIRGYLHLRGEQDQFRFLKEDAETVAENFRSMYQARNFILPIRVGFPNCWSPEQLSSIPVYGFISGVEVRHDPACRKCRDFHVKSRCPKHGLFARLAWFESGKLLLREGMFRHLELQWHVDKVSDDSTGETFAPTELKRVGLVAESAVEDLS